jgi:2-keto-4-pentenoate hydratase
MTQVRVRACRCHGCFQMHSGQRGVPADVSRAYAVQEINTKHWLSKGRRLVGRKIGLTSAAVQKQLGVDQPDFGMLFQDMQASEAEPIPFSTLMQPKVRGFWNLVAAWRCGIRTKRRSIAPQRI